MKYLLLFTLGLTLVSQQALADKGCLTCHKDNKLNRRIVDAGRKLVLDVESLKQSVHADLDCTDCHTQLSDVPAAKPHKAKIGPPTCDGCHEEASKVYAGSVHGRALAKGKKGMALCGDCHGAHDIVKVNNPKSHVFKMRLPFTCARCHQNQQLARQHGIKAPAKHYLESIHGKVLLNQGLAAAPSCTDCHGSHDIQAHSDRRSPIHRSQVPKTCGKCHVRTNKIFNASVHGKALSNKNLKGPVCIDCHTSHDIEPPTNGAFKLNSDKRCGTCHADRLRRYRETYHGKAIVLGLKKVAACYDCHGHHDILPASDPRSQLSAGKKLEVCRRCHPEANESFAAYMSHGDHSDKQNYPRIYWTYVAMSALLLGVFGFFGLHTLLWFGRGVQLFLSDRRGFLEQRKAAKLGRSGRFYERFRPVDRTCHFLVITSFLLLVITGMPLKFYDTDWARWMFSWMGGPEAAGSLHRLGAVITLLYFSIHLLSMVGPLRKARAKFKAEGGGSGLRGFLRVVFGPDSPVPRWQDVKDLIAHLKWLVGLGPRPQFDRWTYWEKFDYLAVFWGVAVIGLSGLILWFPVVATRFLPGWMINVAQVIHSDEALLAAGFIFTFHFFNVHFRPERFPMDPVIFSGRISEEEMLHERRLMYDRLKAEDGLEKLRVSGDWERWGRIFIPVGMIAFTIGVALVVAIYFAMAGRML